MNKGRPWTNEPEIQKDIRKTLHPRDKINWICVKNVEEEVSPALKIEKMPKYEDWKTTQTSAKKNL